MEQQHTDGTSSILHTPFVSYSVVTGFTIVFALVAFIALYVPQCDIYATFLWGSATFLATLVVIMLVHRIIRLRQLYAEMIQQKPLLSATLYGVVGCGALGWGCYGILLATKTVGYCNHNTRLSSIIIVGMSAFFLCNAIVLGIRCGITILQDLALNSDTPPILALVRCSCCSQAVKYTAVLFPFLVLTCITVAAWYQAVSRDCPTTPTRLLMGASLLFATLVIAVMVTALMQMRGLSKPTAKITSSYDPRRRNLVKLIAIVSAGVCAISWSIRCLYWLHQQPQDDVIFHPDICTSYNMEPPIRYVAIELMVIGSSLLFITFCCRLERYFFSVDRHHVDIAMLSPHVTRAPSRVSTPQNLRKYNHLEVYTTSLEEGMRTIE